MSNETSQQPKLTVEVISPNQILFQGQADSISSHNSDGPFDILPLHSHFISLIQKNINIKVGAITRTFPIAQAILRCFNDEVKIYIGISNAPTKETSTPITTSTV